MAEIAEDRLTRIEKLLESLVEMLETPGRHARDFYTIEEAAKLVGRSAYQVREWARNGRIEAEKTFSGCGPHRGWRIPAAAIKEFQDQGLRPPVGGL